MQVCEPFHIQLVSLDTPNSLVDDDCAKKAVAELTRD